MGGQNVYVSVAAQVVNFLILGALLKWVLWDRVLRVLAARQQAIADQFGETQRCRDEAQSLAESYREKLSTFEAEREQRLSGAHDDVETYRKKLSAEARGLVAQQKARWTEALQQQQASFIKELSQQAATRICEIARQVLRDLANEPLEDQIALSFLERLRRLDEASRRTLADTVGNSGKPVNVASAFELPSSTRQQLASTLRDLTGQQVPLEFERATDVSCGIVLRTGSYKIAWSIEDYLDQLTRLVEQAVEQETVLPAQDKDVETC